jgi:hypothetical protein
MRRNSQWNRENVENEAGWTQQLASNKEMEERGANAVRGVEFTQRLEVNLQGAGLEDLERDLDRALRLNCIQVLNLSFNSIHSVPTSIFNQLGSMLELHLENNCLDRLSFPYFKHSPLRIVNLASNNLASLNLEHL